MTRQLGIPFLWVDSLCIIQDDPKDRAKEIAKMAHIYKEPYCTISAASASACHQEFLQPRKPWKNRRHILGLPYLCPDEATGRVYVYRPERHYLEQEPVHSRAWKFQEHVLSCGLITYGSWLLRWGCKTKEACDGGPSDSHVKNLEHLSSSLYSPSLSTLYPGRSLQDLAVASTNGQCDWKYQNMMDLWSDVVQQFITRKLSVASDRPPAISGLAKEYGKLIDGKYLAGLWEVNLVNGLLWRRKSAFRGPRRRSPSWSWTSIDGQVDWRRFRDTTGVQSALLDSKIKLVSPSAPSGAVKSASITIKGRLRKDWFDASSGNRFIFTHGAPIHVHLLA